MRNFYSLLFIFVSFGLFFSCDSDDVIDPIPDSSEPNFIVEIEEIPENNTLLATIDEPEGVGSTDFLLISESQEGAFKIDDNGQILVKSNGYFNYESSPTLTAQFTATKGEEVNTLDLTVNLIDFQEQDQLFEGVTWNSGSDYISINTINGNLTFYDIGDIFQGRGYRLRYDDLNRLSGFDHYIENDGGFASNNHDFTYNENNQIVSVDYSFNYTEGVPGPFTRTVEYEGDKISFYNANNSFSHSFTVDNQGKIISLEDANGIQKNYGYEGANLTSISINGNIEERTYTKFKNPLGDDLFRPVYKGLLFSDGFGSNLSTGESASRFMNKNLLHVSNESFGKYVFNKNDYPIFFLEDDLDDFIVEYHYE